jgi:hypothetical protein
MRGQRESGPCIFVLVLLLVLVIEIARFFEDEFE